MPNPQDLIFSLGIVPVIAITDADQAVPLARALMDGGLPIAEITFRTDAAVDSIRRIQEQMPDMLVGAGTVTSVAQAEKARDAGAQFIVTPGFNPEVVRWCVECGLTIYPGCATPSEVEAAMGLGVNVVKFFPAEQCGGLSTINALAGPYPSMRYMATGGINLKNLGTYLESPMVFACGGTFMAPEDAIRDRRWEEIEALCREAVCAAQGFTLAHVGVSAHDDDDAMDLGRTFANITSQPVRPGYGESLFVGNGLEIKPGPAINGASLCFTVNDVERSCCRLERMGYTLVTNDSRRDRYGRRIAVELADTCRGFKIRLMSRSRR